MIVYAPNPHGSKIGYNNLPHNFDLHCYGNFGIDVSLLLRSNRLGRCLRRNLCRIGGFRILTLTLTWKLDGACEEIDRFGRRNRLGRCLRSNLRRIGDFWILTLTLTCKLDGAWKESPWDRPFRKNQPTSDRAREGIPVEYIKVYSESCRIKDCVLISEIFYFGILVCHCRITIVMVYCPHGVWYPLYVLISCQCIQFHLLQVWLRSHFSVWASHFHSLAWGLWLGPCAVLILPCLDLWRMAFRTVRGE